MKLNQDSIRQEIKYKIFIKDLPILYAWIYSQSNFRKSYNERGVNSLYFDTSKYDFALSNMSGESQRIKIRARYYSPKGKNAIETFCASGSEFIFELKRKKNSFSDKLAFGKTKFIQKDSVTRRLSSLSNELKKYLLNIPSNSNFCTGYNSFII